MDYWFLPGNDFMSRKFNNVLILSSEDAVGGAYEMMYRIASALNADGKKVCLAVRKKHRTDSFIKAITFPSKKKLFKRIINRIESIFGLQYRDVAIDASSIYVFCYDEDERVNYASADVVLKQIPFVPDVIIVGLTRAFLTTKEIGRLYDVTNAKIIYVMLDVFCFTAGCHVLNNCTRFIDGCIDCPAVHTHKTRKIIRNNFQIKQAAYKRIKPSFLVGEGLTKYIAERSPFFDISTHFCAYSFAPSKIFNTDNRNIARQVFNLPINKKIILVACDNLRDDRKGGKYVVEALKLLKDKVSVDELAVLFVGNNPDADMINDIPYESIYVKYIRDERLLSLMYQASTLYVLSSVEDMGPMMLAESLCCGTPVVGFKTGYLLSDIVFKDGVAGYKVDVADAEGLANKIYDVLSMSEIEYNYMSDCAASLGRECFSDVAFVRDFNKYLSRI